MQELSAFFKSDFFVVMAAVLAFAWLSLRVLMSSVRQDVKMPDAEDATSQFTAGDDIYFANSNSNSSASAAQFAALEGEEEPVLDRAYSEPVSVPTSVPELSASVDAPTADENS